MMGLEYGLDEDLFESVVLVEAEAEKEGRRRDGLEDFT